MDKNLEKIITGITATKVHASVLSDEDSPCVVNSYMSTGCCVLDAIMGGGLPVGRITEIYGDTSTGKTLIAEQACATVQQDGGVAVFIDTEAAVSIAMMQEVGVDADKLIYTMPDTVEDVFKIMESSIDLADDSNMLVVWDSIAATSAQAELDKETGQTGYLTHARIISQGLRKLARQIARKNVAVLFLNQAKTNIGVMFGNKVATFGGMSVGFHSSVRVMMKASNKIKSGNTITGINVRAIVTKNKVAPPFREAKLPIFFGHGIDDALSAFEFLKTAKVIQTVGKSYKYDSVSEKFTKRGWYTLFDEHYEKVCDDIDKALGIGDSL